MKFAVIEGLDGSGKSTQIKLIREYLDQKGIEYRYVHFPRTREGLFAKLVARFLRGDMGELDQVDPYLVALIYAGDRHDAREEILSWLNKDIFVLLDRYVISNIAFQCAKIEDEIKRLELKDWIFKLEYEHYKIPRPDVNLFLDVPFDFTANQLNSRREGMDRDYLEGGEDIHEKNLDFQKKVREVYLSLEKDRTLEIVSCFDENNSMLSPVEIFSKIKKRLLL